MWLFQVLLAEIKRRRLSSDGSGFDLPFSPALDDLLDVQIRSRVTTVLAEGTFAPGARRSSMAAGLT